MLTVSKIIVGTPSVACPHCLEILDMCDERYLRGDYVTSDYCDEKFQIFASAQLIIG